MSLNRFVRKIRALAFAGGLILHIVYTPTEANSRDYPSRGLPIPHRMPAAYRSSCCPACGVRAACHLLDAPKRDSGIGLPCRGTGLCYAFRNERWMSTAELDIERIRGLEEEHPPRRADARTGLFNDTDSDSHYGFV